MTDSDIDDAILAEVERSWSKVAWIMVTVSKRFGTSLPEGDEGYNWIGKRIEHLVQIGRLVSQGDISKPRFSEVRLP